MKLLCDRARLASALAPVLPAIPVKDSPKPALKLLYVDARDDTLVLQASNMELSVEVTLDAVKVEEAGRTLLPARPFQALVHEVTDPTLRIDVDGSKFVLPTASGTFEMVTADAQDYPDLGFAADGPGLEIPVSLLVSQVAATEFACAKEATRYAMNGILFATKAGKLATVATDGRRLAMMASVVETAGDETDGWQVLLPHKSLQATVRAIAGLCAGREDATVTLFVNDNAALFVLPHARFSMTRIQGNFPDYDAVIPKDCKNVVEFNKVLLEANLRRATVLTEDINPAVRISFDGSQAKFQSEAAGLGSAETTMDVTLHGKGGHIVFNPHFITDLLKVAKDDVVRFEFDDSNSPGKFVLASGDDVDQTYVVMPITGV